MNTTLICMPTPKTILLHAAIRFSQPKKRKTIFMRCLQNRSNKKLFSGFSVERLQCEKRINDKNNFNEMLIIKIDLHQFITTSE